MLFLFRWSRDRLLQTEDAKSQRKKTKPNDNNIHREMALYQFRVFDTYSPTQAIQSEKYFFLFFLNRIL